MHQTIASDDAQYALDLVKKACEEAGPGLPGSPQERERAALIAKELRSHLGEGNVVTEEFTVAPNAFIGSLALGGFFLILAALLSISTGAFEGISPWVTALPALGFSIIPLLLFVFEFLFGLELIDSFFGKKQSLNVIGILRKPGTTEVRRLLVLSAHHDSAWENNWLRLPGYGFFVATATSVAGLIVMPLITIVQVVAVVTGNTSMVHIGILGWVLLIYPVMPSGILSLFYNTNRKNGGTVPGAADNLSGCSVVVATSRFLARNIEYLSGDTEIRFITFGSEEASLRGSRRYVERHQNELKRLDARVLNLEIVADPEIGILTSEINGTVKNSAETVRSVVKAAKRAGVSYRERPAYLGVASDAGPFSGAGIKATTLLSFKVPGQMLAFYHQKWDAPEVLTREPLLNVLKVAFEWLRNRGE